MSRKELIESLDKRNLMLSETLNAAEALIQNQDALIKLYEDKVRSLKAHQATSDMLIVYYKVIYETACSMCEGKSKWMIDEKPICYCPNCGRHISWI